MQAGAGWDARANRESGQRRATADSRRDQPLMTLNVAVSSIRRRRPRSAFLGLVVVVLAACDGSSPVAPTPAAPQYPEVAGTYSGPLKVTADDPGGVQLTFDGTMRVVVTQSGAQVTMSGSITLYGETEELPATVGTIDEAGEFTFSGDELDNLTMDDADCGESELTSVSFVFSGRTATFSQTIETAECGDWHISATMTRE